MIVLKKWLLEKIPSSRDLIAVYSVIVFLVYSWALLSSFYRLPSWLFYLNLPELISVYAYILSVALLESVLLLIVVVALEFTLFCFLGDRTEFSSRSILLVAIVMSSVIGQLIAYRGYEATELFLKNRFPWWLITALLALPILVFLPKTNIARNIIGGIADRTSVFLFIYLPLSIVSLIVIVFRNL